MIGRSLVASGWIFIVWIVLQITPITLLVYHPVQAQVSDSQVTMYRHFPLDAWGIPRPRISYEEVITPLSDNHNGGHRCIEKGGPFRYIKAGEVGVWDISWAAKCISDPVGYTWSATWFWHIGAMRMGPVSLSASVVKQQAQLNSTEITLRKAAL